MSPTWRGWPLTWVFSAHAHLTRTVRQQLGQTPAQLRRLLRGVAGPLGK